MRRLRRHDWINHVIQDARSLAKTLRNCTADQLRGHTNRLRSYGRATYGRATNDRHGHRLLSLAAAGVIEAIRQTLQMDLFDVQLHAGIVVSCGAVAEMQTGEGKTLSAILPAYVHALAARGVHIATPNSYLAGRDHDKVSPAFERLGMTTGLLVDDATPEQTRAAYQADITYGPGHAFGFDYLRDQLTLSGSTNPAAEIGSAVLQRVRGQSPESCLLQRGLWASIVDEIDHVLLDDAVSPLILSGSSDGQADDAEVHRAACDSAKRLVIETDYSLHGESGGVFLTESGFDRVYQQQSMVMHPRLVRPWHEYVTLALRAMNSLQRDAHYVVHDGAIQIVDASTGRVFQDRSWSAGLHQAVQAAEGLKITSEKTPLAKITRQRFYRYYKSLGGLTGTATGCEREFASVYGLPVAVIPLRIPSKRRLLHESVSVTRVEKYRAIVEETESLQQQGRAILIGTLNIAESLAVAKELNQRGLRFQLLNGVQDADEASIIARSGTAGAITVATNLAGRGTDIVLDDDVADRGGLHVIVTQKHSLARVDRQLIGRCARGGDPGSARVYISAQDTLTTQHAPWIERAIRRANWPENVSGSYFHHRLSRVQQRLQRREIAQRWNLLQSDQETERLLTKKRPSPSGCWQI